MLVCDLEGEREAASEAELEHALMKRYGSGVNHFRGPPDMDDFDHALKSAALNAALSIGYLMQFLDTEDSDCIGDILQLAFDTVYLYVGVQSQCG
jgi:hypothetical protein